MTGCILKRGSSVPVTFLLGFILFFSSFSAFFSPCECLARANKKAHSPPQPLKGPGGRDYPHSGVEMRKIGSGALACWVFSPVQPLPEKAPVVVFLHGWGATAPALYGAWIRHLVRRGNIVLYPLYQEKGKTEPCDVTEYAVQGTCCAIETLRKGFKIFPDTTKFAIVGHSAGGIIAANMAALAEEKGLPRPGALMVIQPGKTWNRVKRFSIPLEKLEKIPEDTLLLVVVGEEDRQVKDIDGKKIFYEASRVKRENKNFVVIRSDYYGAPPLRANHYAPLAGVSIAGIQIRAAESAEDLTGAEEKFWQKYFPAFRFREHEKADALDYFGFWKLFDGLLSAAFYGKEREFALGGTPEQKFMGYWSDGEPVVELLVIK